MNSQRRLLLKTLACSTLLPSTPVQALDPVSAGILIAILPSMVQTIGALISARNDREIARESLDLQRNALVDSIRLEQSKMLSDWLMRGVASEQISYNAAMSVVARKLMSTDFADGSFDKAKSTVGLRDGKLYLERGLQNGTLLANEGAIVTSVYRAEDALPIPVSSAYPISRALKSKAVPQLADSVELSDRQFNDRYAILSGRDFSRARRPTSEPDMRMFSVINRRQIEETGRAESLSMLAPA